MVTGVREIRSLSRDGGVVNGKLHALAPGWRLLFLVSKLAGYALIWLALVLYTIEGALARTKPRGPLQA